MKNEVVRFILVGLVVFFLLARFLALNTSPPGFFVDESSIGYNAWTILKTGRDEHGVAYPIYFKAFGDYKNPLFIYSVAFIFSIFGPSLETVRLTAALWGLGAIVIFIFLVRKAKMRGSALYLTLLLVLTNPWFFQLSRVAFEVASTPFFLFASIASYYSLATQKVITKKLKILWLTTFSLSLAGVFYSYTSGRILAPALLLCGLVLLYKKIPIWQLFLTGLLCLCCVMPALLWEMSNPGALLARYQVVGLSQYTHGLADFIHQAATNYLGHFSPRFLLFGGDGNLRHNPAPLGVLLLSSVPFALVGLVSLFTHKRGRFSYWILFGLLVSPIPSALTIQSPHVLRSVGLLVFICVLFWYGVEYLFSRPKASIILFAWSMTLIVESCLFLSTYFSTYTRSAGVWFDSPIVELVDTGTKYPGPYFLSSKLYPGTEATVDFLRIVNTPSQAIPLTETVVFDPDTIIPESRGVFFFDSDTCQTLPHDFLDTSVFVQNKGGNCLYIRKI